MGNVLRLVTFTFLNCYFVCNYVRTATLRNSHVKLRLRLLCYVLPRYKRPNIFLLLNFAGLSDCGGKSRCVQRYNFQYLLSLRTDRPHECPAIRLARQNFIIFAIEETNRRPMRRSSLIAQEKAGCWGGGEGAVSLFHPLTTFNSLVPFIYLVTTFTLVFVS
jgi:hypothetical protein